MSNDPQVPCNPQVPWTDEQWARVNQVIQEEASRARVAAAFLPLIGPLPGDTDFVRREIISYPAVPALQPPPNQMFIDDRNIWQLATLQVKVRVRAAQLADPDLASVQAMFRRAANVLARLEDAVVFRGLRQRSSGAIEPTDGAPGPGEIWEITSGQAMRGLLHDDNASVTPEGASSSDRLVNAVTQAIGELEGKGHFGPFALVLGNDLFTIAQTPDPGVSPLPQDRIIPFLAGGSLLRSSTLPADKGVMVALGGTPVELIIATDACLQFLQVTAEPAFLFRVCEKIVLRIKESAAIVTLGAIRVQAPDHQRRR
jgi:uncharacterized linocin/CFP29 family protein